MPPRLLMQLVRAKNYAVLLLPFLLPFCTVWRRLNLSQNGGLKLFPLPLKFVLGAPLFLVGLKVKPMLLNMVACINADGPERDADDRWPAVELKAD